MNGYTAVKTSTLLWLLGESENENGEWFERPPGKGKWWWRTDLRASMKPIVSDKIIRALETSRKALEHDVPDNCWATGPLTGNVIEDLIVCPGCRAIHAIDSAMQTAKSGT